MEIKTWGGLDIGTFRLLDAGLLEKMHFPPFRYCRSLSEGTEGGLRRVTWKLVRVIRP